MSLPTLHVENTPGMWLAVACVRYAEADTAYWQYKQGGLSRLEPIEPIMLQHKLNLRKTAYNDLVKWVHDIEAANGKAAGS